MNYENYIKSIRSIYNDPSENTEDAILCINCQMDLTNEEIKEDLKNCFECTEELEEEKELSPERKELLKRFMQFPTLEK